MESEATQSAESADIFNLMAWAHTNRKRLFMAAGAAAVIAAGISFYVWNGKHYETSAGEALSELKPVANAAGEAKAVAPEAYAKIADTYPGSSAAIRALLHAGTAYFDAGKFDQAQAQFERFLKDCGDSPLRPEGMIGVAASLDAAGKTDLAATKYKELIDRHPTDPTMPQAKSALARLYVLQNKPDQALKIYEELTKGRNNDSWTEEAEILGHELIEKHPELKPAPPVPIPAPAPVALPPRAPAPSAMTSAPAATSAPMPLQLSAPKPAAVQTSSVVPVTPKKP